MSIDVVKQASKKISKSTHPWRYFDDRSRDRRFTYKGYEIYIPLSSKMFWVHVNGCQTIWVTEKVANGIHTIQGREKILDLLRNSGYIKDTVTEKSAV